MLSRRDPGPLLALIAAVLAGTLTFGYLSSVRAAHQQALVHQASAAATVSTIIARRDITAGSRVRSGDLAVRRVSRSVVAHGAVTSIKQAAGKLAISDVYAGEPLLTQRLAGGRRGPVASRVISPGKLAIAVAVDAVSGVGGGIASGDRVDVFATYDDGPTELLYRNVLVRGLGGVYPFDARRGGGGVPGLGELTVDAGTVVLEVTSEQAREITSASEKGKLRLALRAARGRL